LASLPPPQVFFVSDWGNQRIQHFDKRTSRSTAVWGSQGSKLGEVNKPVGICLGTGGTELFVADSENHRVQVFDIRTGKATREIGNRKGQGELKFPYDVSVLHTELYVSDQKLSKIMVYGAADGASLGELCTEGSDQGQLRGPWGLAFSQQREAVEMVVADCWNNRIQVFN